MASIGEASTSSYNASEDELVIVEQTSTAPAVKSRKRTVADRQGGDTEDEECETVAVMAKKAPAKEDLVCFICLHIDTQPRPTPCCKKNVHGCCMLEYLNKKNPTDEEEEYDDDLDERCKVRCPHCRSMLCVAPYFVNLSRTKVWPSDPNELLVHFGLSAKDYQAYSHLKYYNKFSRYYRLLRLIGDPSLSEKDLQRVAER